MKATQSLPAGYKEIFSVDLQKNKKLMLAVNVLGVVIALVFGIPAHFLAVPIGELFDLSRGLGPYALRFAALLVGMVVYIFLHEAVHGVAMKLCGTKRVKYGFTGMYAFAGSEDYYPKIPYLCIALAPVVLWGVVLAVLAVLLPAECYWTVQLIQLINLSGAAGDLYVTWLLSRMPKDILIQDAGVAMQVFAPAEE